MSKLKRIRCGNVLDEHGVMKLKTSENPKIEFVKEPRQPINWWPIYDNMNSNYNNYDPHDLYLWKMITKKIVAKSPTYSLKTLMEKHNHAMETQKYVEKAYAK